jgi:hypothetical protein
LKELGVPAPVIVTVWFSVAAYRAPNTQIS